MANCHILLSMTPDITNSEKAAQNWIKIKETVVKTIIDS